MTSGSHSGRRKTNFGAGPWWPDRILGYGIAVGWLIVFGLFIWAIWK